MRKILLIIFTLLICIFPTASFASSESVNVTVPSFPISVNGISVDNMNREYPFILYKGITYFPLTYHDCRFLGIENEYNDQKIMEISKTGVTAAYRDYSRKVKNRKKYKAEVPATNFKINNKFIYNKGE